MEEGDVFFGIMENLTFFDRHVSVCMSFYMNVYL